MIKKLARFVGQYKKNAILGPLFLLGEVFMDIFQPFVVASLIDKGIQAQNTAAIFRYGALMLGCALMSLFLGAMSGVHSSIATTGFAANVRDALFKKIQTFSFKNIDKFSTASLVTRTTTDVNNVQMGFMQILRIATRTPAMLVLSMTMCFIISPKLSTIFLIAVAVVGSVMPMIGRLAGKTFSSVFQRYDTINARVEENVTGARVVKAFVRQDYESEKYAKATHDLRSKFVKAEMVVAMNMPVMTLVINSCTIALSWFGARMVVLSGGTALTTGQLTSMFSYTMQILMSMMMLNMIFVMMSMAGASAKRIIEVLEEEPDIKNGPDPLMTVEDGSIDFNDVTFRYSETSDDPVLRNIDLHIRSGETVGLIGGTGSGKSTLVSLISRLYDAESGSVCVGGRDVRDYDVEVVRNAVSVVLQKNVLFSGTVLSNLRWGKPDATEEECREACRLACADEFIEKMPDGYDSSVEQGGANFSGGQKQRLCIARALLKKPKVLILDDSTSAVDTATDAKIRRAFREVIPETTKIIIAQRIASVQDADRIIVLDDGRVVGFDSHENLLKTNEIYREIYETQTKGGGDFDEPDA